MPVLLTLQVSIAEDKVEPSLSITSQTNFSGAMPAPESSLDEVQLAGEVMQGVLAFARGIKR